MTTGPQDGERHAPGESPRAPRRTRWNELLEVPNDVKDPDLYQLLGMERRTFDATRVESSFRERMSKVQNIRSTKHKDFLEFVKGELRRARRVLSSETQREEYDRDLAADRSRELERFLAPILAGRFLHAATEASLIQTALALGLTEAEALAVIAAEVERTGSVRAAAPGPAGPATAPTLIDVSRDAVRAAVEKARAAESPTDARPDDAAPRPGSEPPVEAELIGNLEPLTGSELRVGSEPPVEAELVASGAEPPELRVGSEPPVEAELATPDASDASSAGRATPEPSPAKAGKPGKAKGRRKRPGGRRGEEAPDPDEPAAETPRGFGLTFCDHCGVSVPERWRKTGEAERVGTRLLCSTCSAEIRAGRTCAGCSRTLAGKDAVSAGGSKRLCAGCAARVQRLKVCTRCQMILPRVAIDRGEAVTHRGKVYCLPCVAAERKAAKPTR